MRARRDDGPTELDQLGFLLGRAFYAYITLLQTRLDELGLGERLRPGMGSLLFALFRQDDRQMSELAAELQFAKSTLTDLVQRMRRAGVVIVTPDANDARAVRVRLAPLARRLEPRCRELAAEMESLLGGALPPADRETLRRGLKRIAATIGERLASSERSSRPSSRRRATRKERGTRSGSTASSRARKSPRRPARTS